MKYAAYDRGFTLIEVILSIAILGIVIAAGLSIYSLGANTQHHTEAQSELQHDTLNVSDFITQALHGATDVQILASASDVPATITDDYKYIYLNSVTSAAGTTLNSVVYKRMNGGMTSLVNQYANSNNFTLSFSSESSGSVCHYIIVGNSGAQSYRMESKVKLTNATIPSSSLTQGAVLKFKINDAALLSFTAITANASDATVGLAADKKGIDYTNNSWVISLSNATLSSSIDNGDIKVSGLPAGLIPTASGTSGGNTITIVVSGTAATAISSTTSVSIQILNSAVTGSNMNNSNIITVTLVPPTSSITPFLTYIIDNNVFVYGNFLSVAGSDSFSGDNSTIVILKQSSPLSLNSSQPISVDNIYIDNTVTLDSSIHLGVTGTTNVVYITGDVNLINGGASINADTVFINGNVTFGSSGTINARLVYILGNVTFNNWSAKINATSSYYIGGTIKLYGSQTLSGQISGTRIYTIPASPTIPSYDITSLLRPASWYLTTKSYSNVTTGQLSSGARIYANTSNGYKSTSVKTNTLNNVVIVASQGNITIPQGGTNLTGVLFAPLGSISFSGDYFTGIAIAKNGFTVTTQGCSVNFKTLDTLFSSSDDYPFQ